MSDIKETCSRALSRKEDYWSEVADRLSWIKKWTKVYDGSQRPNDKWFLGGQLNLCYNCVDRHVEEGYGDRVAFLYNSPVTNSNLEFTFKELQSQVSLLAGVLTKWGVKKGDVVMIYMPMIPEGVFSMLACARLGALHVCVPSGLPAHDLAQRMDHSKPKVIMAASYGYHPPGWINYKTQLDSAFETAKFKTEKILLLQRSFKDPVPLKANRDFDWAKEIMTAKPTSCVPMETNEPIFMVYTSGSTGSPKGIVHSVGRYACRLKADMPFIFGNWQDDETVFMASNFGWIAGHSLVVYGPLIEKIKTVIFEGDPLLSEDVHALYTLISGCKITRAIVRPGIFKLLKGKDPEGKIGSQYNFNKVKMLFTGGERIDSTTMEWATKVFNVSIWNGYGQSEVSSVISGCPDLEIAKSSKIYTDPGQLFPGWDAVIIKGDGQIAKPNELGKILLRLPLPPGGLLCVFENQEQFEKSYFTDFPGYFDTKDEGFLDENGQLRIECRADDIMKVGQIYLSAQSVEEVILSHKAVAECVVASFPDLVWKEIPVAIYVQRDDCRQSPEEINKELGQLVSDKFGSSVKFGGSVRIDELPRTRTGKGHRPSLNSLVKGRHVQATGAVENPNVFDGILEALKMAGFGKDVLLE